MPIVAADQVRPFSRQAAASGPWVPLGTRHVMKGSNDLRAVLQLRRASPPNPPERGEGPRVRVHAPPGANDPAFFEPGRFHQIG